MPPSPGPHLAQVTSLPVSPQVAVSPGMLVQGMALQPDRCVSLSRSHNGSEPQLPICRAGITFTELS